MAHRFTRRQLYDLVWSEPMRDVAAKFGVTLEYHPDGAGILAVDTVAAA